MSVPQSDPFSSKQGWGAVSKVGQTQRKTSAVIISPDLCCVNNQRNGNMLNIENCPETVIPSPTATPQIMIHDAKEHLIRIYKSSVHNFSAVIHQTDKGEGSNKIQGCRRAGRDLSAAPRFTQTSSRNATTQIIKSWVFIQRKLYKLQVKAANRRGESIAS